jgi:hypothetical protein
MDGINMVNVLLIFLTCHYSREATDELEYSKTYYDSHCSLSSRSKLTTKTKS